MSHWRRPNRRNVGFQKYPPRAPFWRRVGLFAAMWALILGAAYLAWMRLAQ